MAIEFKSGQVFNAAEIIMTPGYYQFVYNATAGTGSFEMSMDDGATYQIMTNGEFTSNRDGMVYFSGNRLRVTLTGDARMWLHKAQPLRG